MQVQTSNISPKHETTCLLLNMSWTAMVEGYLVSNGPEHACFRTEGTKSDTGKTLQDPQGFKL